MIENWVRTLGELTVAPLPSSAARTSYASSYLPLRINSRGESGKKGHINQTKAEKTMLFASECAMMQGMWLYRSGRPGGKRHDTDPGANEKPRVSQFDMAKPVIQF